ncbi:Eco1p KNAG_0C02060 [Huiozyma naganishii CBS 8797]|uniref:N-acetyltransferase ECO1 n=1 Tax=Huiozyma naganishii (strain ATCC MYA-139 / BCRC 22969 / CBS 8797 / KCTC 17520 / NBRC 10181 / NCYC 3082 / Yp74L-3) TaxID=1071383 RepID=J7RIG3_HUIN7|nr:hypothetical protein KNAG_0C02060 [Kazachstania naganishii CBS 8797]CCK69318.1 hypothetical protein KNAG_0C02060 [Kazachstania naganishii CBS 8797]
MASRESQASKSYRPKGKSKYIQSQIQFTSATGASKVTKCTKCEMTYARDSVEDIASHHQYHDMHLRGRKWQAGWGHPVSIPNGIPSPPSSSSSLSHARKNSNLANSKIVFIRPNHAGEINATLDIMQIVNDELSAPQDENGFWSGINQTTLQGKAFVYVKNNRAAGVITVEVLEPGRGRWMVYRDKSIVQSVKPNFILGISRIWVCRSERAQGIATKLLEAARLHTITDNPIEKHYMAWSQPSESGGRLALRYNSMKHASGETLIPCYL